MAFSHIEFKRWRAYSHLAELHEQERGPRQVIANSPDASVLLECRWSSCCAGRSRQTNGIEYACGGSLTGQAE
jgi:hypothetical protein